jgi:acetyltransferase
MSVRNLEFLFEPASVAVIGASDKPGRVGTTVWRNVRAGGYRGTAYPVNPSRRELDGERCYPEVGALPAPPELAVICTPPATVPGLIASLGAAGVRAAVVMTAGLSAEQKQAMLDASRPHTLRLLGPNCVGLLCPHVGLNASFAHTSAVLPGELAVVSQSGALVTALLDWTQSRRIGLSHLVSLGEHADVDFGDVLDYLASDARTRAILLYAEGITAAPKFMSAARAAARNKPVVIVKAGRSRSGAQAAVSHTGALAGADVVVDAAIRRAGMLRVDTLRELFMAAETLSRFKGSDDAGLTILTNGGGAGVLAADAADDAGVPLLRLPDDTRAKLDAILPANWSRGNPVDLIGDAPEARYTGALRALLDDRRTGTLLFVHAPTAIAPSDDIARACEPLVRHAQGRVMACWLGERSVAQARAIFESAGIANYDTPEDAVRAFAMLRTYRRNQALLMEAPTATEGPAADLAAAQACVRQALQDGRTLLEQHEAMALLQAYGIPALATQRCEPTAEAAARAATQAGFPVAVKIQSPELTHKSDVGGVCLNLASEDAVRTAVTGMLARVAEKRPDAHVTALVVQPMVSRPRAVELIVGATVDAVFGPVVLFGSGGKSVEVVADRAVALPPLNRVLARDLVSRTAASRLLAGYRDQPPAKIDAVLDVLVKVSQLLADLPEVAELDINPLLADDDGVIAIDARVRVAPATSAGAARFAIRPYPAELSRTLDWQGERLVLRPIRPEDAAIHKAFVERLSPQDLRLRFFSSRRTLAASELARLVQIDYAREMAFVAVRDTANAPPEILGVVRCACDPDNEEAEFAVVVRSDLQRRGLGRVLMERLLDYLRGHGTQRVVGEVLNENTGMRTLVKSLGFSAVPRVAHEDSQRFTLDLRRSPPP